MPDIKKMSAFEKIGYSLVQIIGLFLLGPLQRIFLPGSSSVESLISSTYLYWYTQILTLFSIGLIAYLLISIFDKKLVCYVTRNKEKAIYDVGAKCVNYCVFICIPVFVGAAILMFIDRSTFDEWSLGYVAVLAEVYYVGIWAKFYYKVPLTLWQAHDKTIEVEKLKMEYEQQRFYFKTVLTLTFSFLAAGVIGALKYKYEPYLHGDIGGSEMINEIRKNAFQVAYLLLLIFLLIVAQLNYRMERVMIQLRDLQMEN